AARALAGTRHTPVFPPVPHAAAASVAPALPRGARAPRAVVAALALTASALLLATPAARADYPASPLISVYDSPPAFRRSTAIDLSADGSYVVWASRAPNLVPAGELGQTVVRPDGDVRRPAGGIFRTDLETGVSELVAQAWTGSRELGASQPAVSA